MEKSIKLETLFLVIPFSFLVLLFLSFCINHNVSVALLATFITWSLKMNSMQRSDRCFE